MSDYITEVFSQSGPISKAMPNYEVRHEQIEMAEAVRSALCNSEKIVVEAGTGVGKSFSYLIPLAQYVLERESLAIISTNTISLQEQIIHKDIPFLEDALNKDFKAVLVKGRNNYLCLRRVDRSKSKQKDLFYDEFEIREFARIVAWSYRTLDGSLYDLDQEPDPKVWDMVSANTESCLGKKCPYLKQCFFQKAREKIRDARILVVNHHLFFSNLAIEEEKSMLPEYDALVFDEAHSIENVATEHLGAIFSNSAVRYLMELLFNPKKQKGFLLTIGDQDSMEWVELVRKKSDRFFGHIKEYFEENRLHQDSDSLRIRRPDFVYNELGESLSGLSESLAGAKKNARNKEDELEIGSYVKKINALKDSLEVVLNQSLENYVYWIECSKNKYAKKISINAAPINIGNILKDGLFSMHKAMIFTSATLSVGDGSFRYFKERVGIDDSKELTLGSPFDYKNQVRLYISRDMPRPERVSEYALALSEKIKKFVELTNGGAFVLFTSYSLMNIVYEELENYLNERGFNVLKQGNGLGRSKMLSQFRSREGSVLFGVDSFWQGIDVQGSALSNVIITKLPFAVPDSPIIEARIEELQRKGKDAFLEYNLPEAVLRFKQGFGRLIRSKKDTGIIAILDSRIINKSYGRQFLNSIPECEVIIEN
ncbi:MAG: DEAD/DEAH box helicase [Candidatus Omnitrophica bacterium]|nr:DEAD/DEAH box helicase [Candidatus Omnitrophota bacterium]